MLVLQKVPVVTQELLDVVAKAGLSTLLPRPSHVNDHTGHALDERLQRTVANSFFGSLPTGPELRAEVHSVVQQGGGGDGQAVAKVVGAVVVAADSVSGVGQLCCVALDAKSLAEGMGTAAALHSIVGAAVDVLRALGCKTVQAKGWIDAPVDVRAGSHLAHLSGGVRDQGQALKDALLAAGFVEAEGAEDREIMMGRPLAGLPALPELCAGYAARHTAQETAGLVRTATRKLACVQVCVNWLRVWFV